MDEFCKSDCSLKKLVIVNRDNDEWVSSSIETEQMEDVINAGDTTGRSLSGEQDPFAGDNGALASVQNYASYPDTSDDSWEKLIIAKIDDEEWVISIKTEQVQDVNNADNTTVFAGFSVGEQNPFAGGSVQKNASRSLILDQDLLKVPKPQRQKGSGSCSSIKNKNDKKRAHQRTKWKVHQMQRVAKEMPEKRQEDSKRISELAAKRHYNVKRLQEETQEQRDQRLANMRAYAAKRIATESPEQRQKRLKRMSAYAAKRRSKQRESKII